MPLHLHQPPILYIYNLKDWKPFLGFFPMDMQIHRSYDTLFPPANPINGPCLNNHLRQQRSIIRTWRDIKSYITDLSINDFVNFTN